MAALLYNGSNMDTAAKKKILVVEDDRALSLALIEKFKFEDFTVFSARNGGAGLANALANRPDIILLDIVMPDMDGLTMLEKLRATNEWGKGVKVIIFKNVEPDSEEVMTKITRNSPAFYMVKSDYMLAEVVAKVRECLAAIDAKTKAGK